MYIKSGTYICNEMYHIFHTNFVPGFLKSGTMELLIGLMAVVFLVPRKSDENKTRPTWAQVAKKHLAVG